MTGTRIIETAALNVGWVRTSNVQSGHWPFTRPYSSLGISAVSAVSKLPIVSKLDIGQTDSLRVSGLKSDEIGFGMAEFCQLVT